MDVALKSNGVTIDSRLAALTRSKTTIIISLQKTIKITTQRININVIIKYVYILRSFNEFVHDIFYNFLHCGLVIIHQIGN